MTTFTATEPEPTTPEDHATAQDQEFFEQHPQATDYRRPAVLGEFGAGLYYDGGRTHVTRLLDGLYYRVGAFAAFGDPQAVRIARTPQWRPWGAEIPPEIAEADALYRTPEALAVIALLEAEDKIRKEES